MDHAMASNFISVAQDQEKWQVRAGRGENRENKQILTARRWGCPSPPFPHHEVTNVHPALQDRTKLQNTQQEQQQDLRLLESPHSSMKVPNLLAHLPLLHYTHTRTNKHNLDKN
jgi:hypothetical protein